MSQRRTVPCGRDTGPANRQGGSFRFATNGKYSCHQHLPGCDLSGGLITTGRTLIPSRDYTGSAALDCDSMVVTRSQAPSHLPSHPQSHSILREPLISLTRPNTTIQAPSRGKGREKARRDPPKTGGFPAQWAFLRRTHRAGRSGLNASMLEGEEPAVAVVGRWSGRRWSPSSGLWTPSLPWTRTTRPQQLGKPRRARFSTGAHSRRLHRDRHE